jgi:HEAT repeat protein
LADFENTYSEAAFYAALREIREELKRGVLAAFKKGDPETYQRANGVIGDLESFGSIMDLFTALKHEDAERREQATRILRNLQDEVLLPFLALIKENPEVKAQVMDTFSPWIGDSLDPFIEAFECGNGLEEAIVNLFIQALQHGTRESRIHAAQTLAQIGEPAIEPLISVLKEGATEQKYLAAGALLIISEPSLPSLLEVIGDNDPEAKDMAARTIAQMGPVAIDPVLSAPWRDDEDVRFYSTIILAKIGSPAVKPLLDEVRTGNAEMEHFVGSVLLTMEEPAIEPLLDALDEEDPILRDFAGNVLIQMGDQAVGPLATRFHASKRNEEAQILISMLLAEIGEPAVGELIEILQSGEQDEKVIAMYALTQIGYPAVEPLKRLRDEGDPELEKYVEYPLKKIQQHETINAGSQ